MIVLAKLEIGTALNALFVQQTLTGMEKHASLVMVVDCGIHLIWFANVPMIPNGMESLV